MLKILLPLLLIASCSSQKELQKGEIDLSILHTNDHHGHFLKDRKAQHGMAARKTLVDEQRASIKKSGGHSLLLSGGDINTGTMESDLFDAEPDFMGMKAIGYDAMALGNHEFDNSFKILKKQQKIAGFPFLSANIFFKGTNKRIFEPYYIVKKMGGLKIGIFGLTTKDTPFKASHMDAGRLFDFKDIITVAKDVVKELKEKEKVDFIIVTTHVGHVGSQTSNGDIKLAKAVPGINVIVGGHSQEVIKAERHGGAIIVQAHEWGKYLGRLDLRISKNAIKMKSYELININKAKKIDGKYTILAPVIKEDPELLKLFAPYKEKTEKLSLENVAVLDRDLPAGRTDVRTKQVAVAQFMGAALKSKSKAIEVVILNGGSLRSTLKAGNLNRKELHKLHPYGNTIVSIKLSKDEFFKYMETIAEHVLTARKGPIGGNPQLVNLKIKIKNGKLFSVSDRRETWTLEKRGNKVVGSKKSITMGTLNFLARGGDSYPDITKHKNYVDTGFMINAAMMDYAKKLKKINASFYEMNIQNLISIE